MAPPETEALPLHATDPLLWSLFETHGHPLWVFDRNSLAVVTSNEAAEQFYGYTRAEFQQRTVHDLLHPEDVALLQQDLPPRAWQTPSPGQHRHKNGTWLDVVQRLHRLHPDPPHVLVLVTSQSRQPGQRFRALFERASDGIFLLDRSGRFVDVNPRACHLTGYPREHLLRLTLQDLLTPEPLAALSTVLQTMLDDPHLLQEWPMRHADGTLRTVELSGSLVEPDLVQVSLRDITTYKHAEEELQQSRLHLENALAVRTAAEEALRQSEERYREFIRISAEGIYRVELPEPVSFELPWQEFARRNLEQAYIAECSEAFARMYGYEHPDDLAGVRITDLWAGTFDEQVEHLQEWIAARFTLIDQETQEYDKDGNLRYFLNNTIGIIEHNTLVRVWGTQRDITDRKHAEAALVRSQQQVEAILNSVEGIVWEANAQTFEIRFISQQVERMTGFPVECWMADPGFWISRIHPEDVARVLETARTYIARGEDYSAEYRFLHADGHLLWLRNLVTITCHQGVPTLVHGIGVDITEQRRAEEAIRTLNETLEERVRDRTAQLEAANQALAFSNRELESFSYSVSHDLRTPLRALEGYSTILLHHAAPRLDPQHQHYLQQIHTSAQHLDALIEGLLRLTRLAQRELHHQPVDLSTLATAIAQTLHTQEPDRKVTFRIEPGLTAQGDATLLKNVLQNLFENAWKFTRHHPTAHITFGRTRREDQWCFFVQDDGAGFDMHYATKLFRTFQRLHSDEEFAGTGIGLATVQRILQRHGGRIWAEATVEAGATFYFTL